MPDKPTLQYKSDLFLNSLIRIDIPAADAVAFMTWLMAHDSVDGAGRVLKDMANQIMERLYTPASLKASEAHYVEDEAPQGMTIRVPFNLPFPTTPPGFFNMEANRCEVCGRVAGAPSAPCSDCPDVQGR